MNGSSPIEFFDSALLAIMADALALATRERPHLSTHDIAARILEAARGGESDVGRLAQAGIGDA